MGFLVGCQVSYLPGGATRTTSFTVDRKYYPELRDKLVAGVEEWVELETPHGSKGTFFTGWMVDIFDVTPEYKAAREEWEHEDAKEEKAREREIDLQ
jgi:hypothetical protein